MFAHFEYCLEVLSKDLLRNAYETQVFDAIFICNGHYNEPYIPVFEGIDAFRGQKMHSHDYRRPEQYKDETVLVIGSGPSGKDIVYEIASKAKKVIFSHHRNLTGHILPLNVLQVGDVKCFKQNTVQFENDAEEHVSCVLFCTGEHHHRFLLLLLCSLIIDYLFI